jgi:enoyl-CoA hydratase/carnithine racemase
MNEFVKVTVTDAVATATFHRPPMNMIDRAAISEIDRTLQDLERRADVKVVVLTGGGGAPPFGADAAMLSALERWEDVVTLAELGHSALWRLETMSKPVIAALHDGMCLGGALELSLACHMRVAGSGLVFCHPETAASMMPGWGGTQRLTRIVGAAKATEIILTATPITAEEALRIGLVNHVVPSSEVLSKALAIGSVIAQKRSVSIAASMAAIGYEWRHGLRDGLAEELRQFQRTFDPGKLREGVQAVLRGTPRAWTD